MEKKLKRVLFVFVMLVLLFPMLQQTFNIIKIAPLKGVVVNSADTVFTFKGWFKGNYQTKKEDYCKDNFGFRNIMIRINNQIAFWIDRIALANGVIIGKENYLYDLGQINAYYGTDFKGVKPIEEAMYKYKAIHDKLKEKGIDLITVIAPSKATFFPEYIPDKYVKRKDTTIYDCYISKMKEMNLPFMDFNDYFINNKHKYPYPLYPKFGLH